MAKTGVKKGNNNESGSVARRNTSGKSNSTAASVDTDLTIRALKNEVMRKAAVGGSKGQEPALEKSSKSKDVASDDNLKIGALKNEVMRKAAGNKPKGEKSVAKQDRKSNDVTVDDDLTIGALENEVRGKVAGDKSEGENSVAKESSELKDSDVDDNLKIGALKKAVLRKVSGGKSKGEKSVARNNEAGDGAKLVVEEEDTQTILKEEIKQDTSTPVTRKRGADGEIVRAFWLSPTLSSSRLRPRKEVPAFRLVDLGDDDNERIVGKKVKVYWSGSRKWFTGRIKAFDYEKRLHNILYADGDSEMLDLRKELFELEILPTDGFKLRTKPSSVMKVNGLDGKGSSDTWSEDTEMVDAEKVAKQSEPRDRMAAIAVKKKRSMTQSRRKNKEKEDIDANNEAVEVDYQEGDEKIDSPAREACEEEGGMLAEAQRKKPDFNVKEKEDHQVEKQTEIEDIMEEMAANVKVPVLPNEVEEKVISRKINVEGPGDVDTVKLCNETEILSKAASEGACEVSDDALHSLPKTPEDEDPETLKVKMKAENIEEGMYKEGNVTGQKTVKARKTKDDKK
jgi:hypothetical protein